MKETEEKKNTYINDTFCIIDGARTREHICKDEINLIKLRSSRYGINLWDEYCRKHPSFKGELPITEDQNDFGKRYLHNLAYTPLGEKRKNNPFGNRELDIILDKHSNFTFNGLSDRGNCSEWKSFTPHWRLYSGNGKNYFGYYMYLSEIVIDE